MSPEEKVALRKFIEARGEKLWFLGAKHFYLNDNTRIYSTGESYWPKFWVEIKDPVEGWVEVAHREGPWQEDILAMARELGKSQQERLESAYKHRAEGTDTRFNKLGID